MGPKRLGLVDGNSLSITGIEQGCISFKPSGDTDRANSGFGCAVTDALEAICAAGGIAGDVSGLSVIGEQVEHVWITSGVFGVGALTGGLLSNSV